MPDLTKADKNTLVSYWIGIDGLGTDRVIQAGFDAKKDSDGTVTYQAFYEWSPEKQKFIPTSDFKASVGDGEYCDHVTDRQFRLVADDTT